MSITVGTPRGKLRMQCGIVCICDFCRFFCNDVCKYCHVTMSKYFLSGNIARLCIEKKNYKTIKDYLCVPPFFRQASEFQCSLQVFFKICNSIYIKKVWNFAWSFVESLHQTCKHGWKFVASSSAKFRSWLKVWYNPLNLFAANSQAPCKQGQRSFAWKNLFARALRPNSLGYRCLWRGLLLPFQIAGVLSKILPQLPFFSILHSNLGICP